MSENIRMAGLVILYNPTMEENLDLIKNINTYQNILDVLYVVDNSEKCDVELVDRLKKNIKIKYIQNNTNFGIAKALNQGAKLAINEGFEWLLTMDQDSYFEKNKASQYFSCFEKFYHKEEVAVFAPFYNGIWNENSKTRPSNLCEYRRITAAMTSGCILNLNIYKLIGGFKNKLFIDEVDNDYCLRAIVNKFQIIHFQHIELKHNLGISITVRSKLFFLIFSIGKHPRFKEKARQNNFILKIPTHSPKRMYYITRNNFYIWKKYHRRFPRIIKQRMKTFIKRFFFLIIFEDSKIDKLSMMKKGLKDFITGKYGYLS